MNLTNLLNKLKPVLHTFPIEDETLYIHRPTGRDMALCTDMAKTIIYCTKDENGDSIFSDEDIDGRINIHAIDYQFQQKIYLAIVNLLETKVDEIEKK